MRLLSLPAPIAAFALALVVVPERPARVRFATSPDGRLLATTLRRDGGYAVDLTSREDETIAVATFSEEPHPRWTGPAELRIGGTARIPNARVILGKTVVRVATP